MDSMVRKLPIGIQSFEKLIDEDFIYIDKTAYIYELVHRGVPIFLSRPRRFGKSLLLSTLRAYWEGKKELFRGLKIEELEQDNTDAWQPYPVFYIDFNRKNYLETGSLEEVLDGMLKDWEAVYGGDPAAALEDRFKLLLHAAYKQTGRRCVVLVDEYDKSLLETMEDQKLLEHNKAVFKGFFSLLKSEDAYLQFVFITGVTKFSKVSIFSDLNQLEDISFDEEYSGLCGITEKELVTDLEPEIARLQKDRSLTKEECLAKLKRTYDGYHFSAGGEGVYNPYSLLTVLKKRRFGSFWYETGTPTFLVRRLKAMDFDVRQFGDRTVQSTEAVLADYRSDDPDPIPLLYQSGYLTITKYIEDDIYVLGFPNDEVRYAFLQSLMPEYVRECGAGSGKDVFALKQYVENGETEGIRKVLTALFAGITYSANETPFEHYFQTVIYLVFTLLGKYIHCEQHTSRGRIDCVLETERFVYLFEFKRDESAEKALQQIEDMHYADPYAADQRVIYRIGVNFSSETRQLEDWKVLEKQSK